MANPQKVDKAQPMRECEQALVDTVNELVDWTDNPPVEETVNTVAPPLNATLPAKCEKDTSVAVAGNSQSTMENSVAVGWGSLAGNANTVALGSLAGATGNAGTAVGKGADASGVNSVALGAGSVADTKDTVSVGTSESKRRIVNVADGTEASDAATKSYVDSAVELLGRMHIYKNYTECAPNSVATISIARKQPLKGVPCVTCGLCAARGPQVCPTVTCCYLTSGNDIVVYINNPTNLTIGCIVTLLVIERNEG